MTFSIGQKVRSNQTHFDYVVVGHDEDTLEGEEVVIVRAVSDEDVIFPIRVVDLSEIVETRNYSGRLYLRDNILNILSKA